MSAAKRPIVPPQKAAKKAVKGKPFAKGKDPRRNLTKPGTGRPPDEFKARMRQLATLPEVEAELERVLSSSSHPHWIGALKHATEHGYGKANQPVEHGVSDSIAALILGTPKVG